MRCLHLPKFYESNHMLIQADWWKPFLHTDSPCLDFEVYFIGHLKQTGGDKEEVKSNSVRISLQCRHALQSFLFTFPVIST